MKRRLYKDRRLDRAYTAYVNEWLRGLTGKRTELFMEDGSPRRHGAMSRIIFWRAFFREPDLGGRSVDRRGTLGQAIKAAGQDCGREQRRRDREQRGREAYQGARYAIRHGRGSAKDLERVLRDEERYSVGS